MKISRYSKLGLLILFSIVVFVWGVNFLKGFDLLRKNTVYHVFYPYIGGLVESSSITLNGYQVGQVKEIRFSDRHDGSLLVSLAIQGDVRIPKGTIARITSSDIMGTKSIALNLGPGPGYCAGNDTIAGVVEGDLKEQVSMQVLPLKNKAEQLLSSLDSALTVVTYVFNAESRRNITESFENINQTIQNLEVSTGILRKLMSSQQNSMANILENLSGITDTLHASSGNFSNIVKTVSAISDSISGINIRQSAEALSQSVEGLNRIVSKIDQGEGTAGLLVHNEELYWNLAQLSLTLDDLLTDIRENPKRYVRFSAIDLSKDYHIMAPESNTGRKVKYIFRVNLVTSDVRVNTDNPLFEQFQPVEEMAISGDYHYLTGKTTDFTRITELNRRAKEVFPEATIVAFRNGRMVKLERAIGN